VRYKGCSIRAALEAIEMNGAVCAGAGVKEATLRGGYDTLPAGQGKGSTGLLEWRIKLSVRGYERSCIVILYDH
jgi:hypothetical protein